MVWNAIGATDVQMLRCGASAQPQAVGCAVRTGRLPIRMVYPPARNQLLTSCLAAWL